MAKADSFRVRHNLIISHVHKEARNAVFRSDSVQRPVDYSTRLEKASTILHILLQPGNIFEHYLLLLTKYFQG